jgi:predicted nucleic acid-binding protein
MALIHVDTDILIDAANGDAMAANWLHQTSQSTTLAISVITQMEIVVGCRNKVELRNRENFLRAFQVLKITPEICDRAVALL